MLCKAVIFLLTAVPLALSVGYKRCVGGYQNIGLGLSLITETYLPFWIDPREPQCYNLVVASNTTPMPEYLDSLQASLLLTTTVNAAVSETLRNNNTYWQQLATQYGPGNWADMDMLYGRHVVVANGPSGANRTTSFLSIYNETGGQSNGHMEDHSTSWRLRTKLCFDTTSRSNSRFAAEGRTGVWREVNQYTKPSSEVQVYRQRETLLLVFLVLPVVSLFAFLAKMWFHTVDSK